MVRTSRRRLLAVGGMAALTGCIADVTPDEDTPADSATPAEETTTEGTTTPETTTTPSGEGSMPEGMVTALEALPASIDETALSTLRVTKPLPTSNTTPLVGLGGDIAEALGLRREAVDLAVHALYGEDYRGLTVITGSFDADEPTIPESDSEVTTYRAEGLFVAAFENDGDSWQAAIDAAKATRNGNRDSVLSDEDFVRTLRPVAGSDMVVGAPTVPANRGLGIPAVNADIEELSSLAIGYDVLAERTVGLTYVALFERSSAVDRGPIDRIAGETFDVKADALSFERDGRRLIATGRTELPPRRDPEASPAVAFEIEYDEDSGTATLTHESGEAADPETVTVLVEGEAADVDWGGEQITAGDSVQFDAEPLSYVAVEWTDPEDDGIYDVLADHVLGARNAFDSRYDAEADQAIFTYIGERPARTDHLRVRHRTEQSGSSEDVDRQEISERTDSLDPGEEIVIDGVQYGDQVTLSAHYEWRNGGGAHSLSYVRARPPGHFDLEEGESERRLVFHGQSPQPAENYRISVGGEPAATQFDDEYTTLEANDGVAFDGEAGQEVRVEYVAEDEPVEVFARRLRPMVSFDLRRERTGFELVYTATEEWPADAFEVHVYAGEDRTRRFETETLTQGDTIALDAPLRWVTVEWTGGEEPIHIASYHVRELLQFELVDGSSGRELVFTGSGQWPAEELQVSVGGETVENAFDDGTVTEGDGVELDVSQGSEVVVTWTVTEEPSEVFAETVHPPFDFEFEYDSSEDRLRIVSATATPLDADSLGVFVGGADPHRLPDAWAEQYDTVESGDAITVDVPSSLEVATVYHEKWDARDAFEVDSAS